MFEHLIQNNISDQLLAQVKEAYKRLTGTDQFVGAYPLTMQQEHLEDLARDYLISPKIDGRRLLLFITSVQDEHSNQLVIGVDDPSQFFITYVRCKNFENTIIDLEYVSKNKTCYIFDIIAWCGEDLRGQQSYDLTQRLTCIEQLLPNLSSVEGKIRFEKKRYFSPAETTLKSELIESTSDVSNKYSVDGYIFVAKNAPYPLLSRSEAILKWKPAQLSTIDFLTKPILEDPSHNNLIVELYVLREYKRSQKVHQLFAPIENPNAGFCSITHEQAKAFSLFDTTSRLIEYSYDLKKKRFFPVRDRPDRYKANFISEAQSVWKSICFPVLSSQLERCFKVGK